MVDSKPAAEAQMNIKEHYIIVILGFIVVSFSSGVLAYKWAQSEIQNEVAVQVNALSGRLNESQSNFRTIVNKTIESQKDSPSGTWCGLCGDVSHSIKTCMGENVCNRCPMGWEHQGWSNFLWGDGGTLDYICVKN